MEHMQISTIKLDLKQRILEANNHILDFFDLQLEKIINQSIADVCAPFKQLDAIIAALKTEQQQSLILLCNLSGKHADSLFLLYVIVNKNANGSSITFINWLNWLHNINNSLESGYNFIADFNRTTCKSKFGRISQICCFKALYPLLMHVPRKFKTSPPALYDIMHLFVKKPNEVMNQHYTRNVLSRLQTALRKETGYIHRELIDIIKDEKLLIFKYKGHIYIPNTVLQEEIFYPIEADQFLEFTLKDR